VSPARQERLMPGGIPRYVRVYDNGGRTLDRYTVVYTGRYRHKTQGATWVCHMSDDPYHPQGVGLHHEWMPNDSWVHEDGKVQHSPDRPRHGHLGACIPFDKLPEPCQRLVREDYTHLWELTDAA
jgi:hypothetical protein